MKKYLYAGLLSACLAAPAFAAAGKFVPRSADEPLHRRTILLCMAVMAGLHACQYRPRLARRNLPAGQP